MEKSYEESRAAAIRKYRAIVQRLKKGKHYLPEHEKARLEQQLFVLEIEYNL